MAREPDGEMPWTVSDDVARFDYATGAWCIVCVRLTQFVSWVLNEKLFVHAVRRRYRRIWLETGERYVRRQAIWTTQRSVDEEGRHEAMRQRQEARKQQRAQEQREAEQRQRQEAEARRAEQQQQRETERAAEWARFEQEMAEQRQQRQIEAEHARQRREAEERQRQEEARAAEQARIQQEQREQQAARGWWDGVPAAQLQQLCAAVADPVRRREGTRVEFDQEPTVGSGYGIAAYRNRHLYGILRPSPESLHRVPPAVPVFLRNAREARQIIDASVIAPDRVVYFDLPDFEQGALI
jgi:hypothetical protein